MHPEKRVLLCPSGADGVSVGSGFGVGAAGPSRIGGRRRRDKPRTWNDGRHPVRVAAVVVRRGQPSTVNSSSMPRVKCGSPAGMLASGPLASGSSVIPTGTKQIIR